jgi:collagen type VII alpha
MATVTSKGAQGAVNFSTAGAWVGDAKPQTNDTAVVADGDIITLDENFSGILQAAGNTGYYALASGSINVTGSVSYGGTSTSGMIRVTGGTLQITGGGVGTTAVTSSAAGYAIVASSASTLVISNAGGTAASGTSTGRVISRIGTGALTIEGNITNSGAGTCVYNDSTSNSSTWAGNAAVTDGTGYNCAKGTTAWTPQTGISSALSGTATTTCAGVYATGGTINITGNLSTSNTNNYGGRRCSAVAASAGTITYVGDRTLAVNTECVLEIFTTGTINLATAGDNLVLANSGTFLVLKNNGTLNTADAGAGAASVVNQTATAYAAIQGGTTAQRGIIAGPTIPAEADVLEGSGAFGYANALTPALEADNVLDASGGNYHAPTAGEVLSTAAFGVAPQTGTYHVATTGEVKDGVTFGAGSAETGTYSPGGTFAEGQADQLATDVGVLNTNKDEMIPANDSLQAAFGCDAGTAAGGSGGVPVFGGHVARR